MNIYVPRSATWVFWPCVLALASTLAFAMGWSAGVDNGRSWAAREIEPEIQANRDAMSALSDRLIYLEEWASFETLAARWRDNRMDNAEFGDIPLKLASDLGGNDAPQQPL